MNPRIEDSMNRVAHGARGRYQAVVEKARNRTEEAAGRVARGKEPVKTLSRLGLQLSAVSHRATDNVLKQQAKMVEHQIDAVAGRLSAAADATSLRDLVRTQIRLVPKNASQMITDTRDTLGVVAGAGAEIRDLIVGTVRELRGRAPSRKPAAKTAKAKKTTAKPAAKTTAKPAAKTAAKPAAKPASTPAKAAKPAKTTAKPAAPRKKAAKKTASKAVARRETTAVVATSDDKTPA